MLEQHLERSVNDDDLSGHSGLSGEFLLAE